jgi:hypothetical protein
MGGPDGCTGKSATTTAAINATGTFSSTARGVDSSARSVVDKCAMRLFVFTLTSYETSGYGAPRRSGLAADEGVRLRVAEQSISAALLRNRLGRAFKIVSSES